MTIKFGEIDIQGGIVATTLGSGPFHPAFNVKATNTTYYWPNVTHPDEEQAASWARAALNGVFAQAAEDMSKWNIWPV
jgi:hypothetical protein